MSPYVVNRRIETIFQRLNGEPKVQQGLRFIEADQSQAIADQKEMVVIEAPTFEERQRAAYYADRLRALGLTEVQIDRHGNVWSKRPGKGSGPTVLLEAHLDTVFPFGTNVTPVEKDGRIYAPGICDDTRGLAANLSVVRAFSETGIETDGDIIFAATVREEGLGGMSGMMDLLGDHPEVSATISIDGAGYETITYQGTGIRNFEVNYSGPGGHAYGAFGIPSPVHAAARAVTKLADLRPPASPKTTFTVSLIEGGHQIHAIAQRAGFKINMRSDDPLELDRLQEQAIAAFQAGAEEENARWGKDLVSVEYKMILDVPAGTQPDDAPIVQAAWKATESIGAEPRLVPGGCTNTNMPIKLGIPAVTLGRGGKEGGIHSLGEWFDPEGTYRSPQKSFLMLLALAGMHGVTKSVLD